MAEKLYRLITGFQAKRKGQGGSRMFRQLSFRAPEGIEYARSWTIEDWHAALDVLATLDEAGDEHEFVKVPESELTSRAAIATNKGDELAQQLLAGQEQIATMLGAVMGALPKGQQAKVAAKLAEAAAETPAQPAE